MPSTNTVSPQQAAAIAFRRQGDVLEVCLIRRWNSRNWGIPKGMIDPGDTPEETALNEAWEEAGLTGRLQGDPVGTYEYRKWGMRLVVVVYVMEVLEEHAEWQEGDLRERKWTSFEEAALLLADHPAQSLVARVAALVAGDIA